MSITNKSLHITETEHVNLWSGRSFSDLIQQLIKESSSKIDVTEYPGKADIILFLEPCRLKDRNYVKTLSKNDIFKQYASKSYIYSIDDFSIAFLPGVYVNLEKKHHIKTHRLVAIYFRQMVLLTLFTKSIETLNQNIRLVFEPQ